MHVVENIQIVFHLALDKTENVATTEHMTKVCLIVVKMEVFKRLVTVEKIHHALLL